MEYKLGRYVILFFIVCFGLNYSAKSQTKSNDSLPYDIDSVFVWGSFSDVIYFNEIDTVYYSNGIPKEISYGKDGKIIRKKFFYESGVLRTMYNKNEDEQKDGIEAKWFENGRIEYFSCYKKGNFNDSTIGWFSNGIKQREGHFVDGNGFSIEYYTNGSIYKELEIKGNIETVAMKLYCENGQLIESHPNLPCYNLVTYYCNGKTKSKGNYCKDATIHGRWQEYYENGKLKSDGFYSETSFEVKDSPYKITLKLNEWKYYFENGNPERIEKYNSDGKPSGKWKYFFNNGKISKVEVYKKGKLKKTKNFN